MTCRAEAALRPRSHGRSDGQKTFCDGGLKVSASSSLKSGLGCLGFIPKGIVLQMSGGTFLRIRGRLFSMDITLCCTAGPLWNAAIWVAWKVPFPSSVSSRMSMLSAANCTKCPDSRLDGTMALCFSYLSSCFWAMAVSIRNSWS